VLGDVVDVTDPKPGRRHCGSSIPLLNGVGQLMSQQAPSRRSARRVPTRSEGDVLADGVCARTHCIGGLRGTSVDVHFHLAEVVAEARFQGCPSIGIQRLAGGAQDIAHNRRRHGWTTACRDAVDRLLIVLVAGARPDAAATQH